MLKNTFFLMFLAILSAPASVQASYVRIATWNVFDLPEQVFPVESAKRMNRAVASVENIYGPLDEIDAFVFNELYVYHDRETVLSDLFERGFKYCATLTSTDPRDLLSMAGITVASRWPI